MHSPYLAAPARARRFTSLLLVVPTQAVAGPRAAKGGLREASCSGGPTTLFDKVWKDHLVEVQDDGTALIYIDRHLVHEVTSPQAFEGLRNAGRKVRQPGNTLATVDHNVPTSDRSAFESVETFIKEMESQTQVLALEDNVKEFGVAYFGIQDQRQGIVHIIGPEQGFTLPGTTVVCGDSHTATHGAFGALAFGIGTSEVEHVLATQTLLQKKAKNMRIEVRINPNESALNSVGPLRGGWVGRAGGTLRAAGAPALRVGPTGARPTRSRRGGRGRAGQVVALRGEGQSSRSTLGDSSPGGGMKLAWKRRCVSSFSFSRGRRSRASLRRA